MYETDIWEVSLNVCGSRLNMIVPWSDKRDKLGSKRKKGAVFQKEGPWVPLAVTISSLSPSLIYTSVSSTGETPGIQERLQKRGKNMGTMVLKENAGVALELHEIILYCRLHGGIFGFWVSSDQLPVQMLVRHVLQPQMYCPVSLRRGFLCKLL